MTEAPFQVGLVQMSCRVGDKSWNLAHARERLQLLPRRVRVACLPEFFNTGYHLDLIGDAFFELAEPIPGPTTTALGEVARSRKMAILRERQQEPVLRSRRPALYR